MDVDNLGRIEYALKDYGSLEGLLKADVDWLCTAYRNSQQQLAAMTVERDVAVARESVLRGMLSAANGVCVWRQLDDDGRHFPHTCRNVSVCEFLANPSSAAEKPK